MNCIGLCLIKFIFSVFELKTLNPGIILTLPSSLKGVIQTVIGPTSREGDEYFPVSNLLQISTSILLSLWFQISTSIPLSLWFSQSKDSMNKLMMASDLMMVKTIS